MTENHHFRGHEICLQLLRVGTSHIRWVWRIDGRHVSKGVQMLASEEVARSEALLYAQIAIERIERATTREAH